MLQAYDLMEQLLSAIEDHITDYLVMVLERLDLAGLLLSSSNYNLFSNLKGLSVNTDFKPFAPNF